MLEISWMAAMGAVAGMHCIFMCGPLALALPLGMKSKRQQLVLRVLFILGRVMVYAAMGGLVGVAGKPIYWLDFQWIFATIVLLAFVGWVSFQRFDFLLPARNFIQKQARELLHIQPKMAFFSLGMANGLLPCGAVYAALAFATVSGSALNGIVSMLIFGLATSWWHILLMFGWQIPAFSSPGLRFLSSPKASMAMVSIFLLFRMIQTTNIQPESQPGHDRLPPKELHLCGK